MSQNIIAAEQQRGEQQLEKVNSFIARNYWMWIAVAYVIYPCATVVSAVTEGTHIHLRLAATLGPDSTLGWIFTLCLVILIETLKFFTGKGAVDDWQANAFVLGGVDRVMFLAKVFGFIAISIFSYRLSTKGADMATHHITKQTRPPTLVNKDSLNALFDSRLAPIQKSIEAYQNTKWRGSITRDALAGMNAASKQVEAIENDRRAALAIAMQQDSLVSANWVSDTAETGSFFTVFAGIGEFVCLVSLLFIGVYDQGVMKEVKKTAGITTAAPTQVQQGGIGLQMAAPPATAYQAPGSSTHVVLSASNAPVQIPQQPIGFFVRAKEAANPLLQHVATTEIEIDRKRLHAAWTHTYGRYQAYFRKAGKPDANAIGRAKELAELIKIEAEMDSMGVDTKPYIQRRQNYLQSKIN